MLRLSHERPGELTFVMLGPLTNLALALQLDPSLPQRVKRLVVMGGAVTGVGNTSVAAEFNIAFDPESAHIVFSRWPQFELVDWEAVLEHPLAHADVDRWLAADTVRARFYDAISRQTRLWSLDRNASHWHSADPLAVAVAIAPEGILETEERPVAIELDGRLTRGATIVDWKRRGGQPDNARILRRYDQQRFEAMLEAALLRH
jgi:purine nucleosidase